MNPTAAIQLTSWKTHLLLPLFKALTPRLLQVEAALTGQTPCSLYVDQAEEPQAAALRIGICWYIAGNPNTEFLQSVNVLLPCEAYSVLILDPSLAADQRDILCNDLYFARGRSRYAERVISDPFHQPLSEGYHVLPVDGHLLEGDLEGAADLRQDILHDWTSMEIYDRDGFGFAAVKGAKIVSQSRTVYVSGGRCEIGVHTDTDHRLKGLGAHVASLTANEAFARGLASVGWMSWANNTGSIAVSNRIGFTQRCEYDVFINHWPAGNPGDMTSEEFRDFGLDYEKQFAKNPPSRSGYPHVVAATAWSLAGEESRCRGHLHHAINIGWLKTIDQLRALWPKLFQNPMVFENEEWMAVFSRLLPTESGD